MKNSASHSIKTVCAVAMLASLSGCTFTRGQASPGYSPRPVPISVQPTEPSSGVTNPDRRLPRTGFRLQTGPAPTQQTTPPVQSLPIQSLPIQSLPVQPLPPYPPAPAGLSTPAGQPHPLPFLNVKVRNWHQSKDRIFVVADQHDLQRKLHSARRMWVVLSASFYHPQTFWKAFPMFTQKCVVDKRIADLKSFEAVPVPLGSVGAKHELEISGARGAYYAAVLVEKNDGSLQSVTVVHIGKVPATHQRIGLHNSHPVTRSRSADKPVWPLCR